MQKARDDMGVNINFRKDYGMDIETLLAQIRAWRKGGYSDEEIQRELDNLARDPEKKREGEKDAEM